MCVSVGVKTFILLFALQVLPSLSITVNHRVGKIAAKKRIELSPIFIECALNDMVRLSAPMISEKDQYYLSAPNGHTNKLELHAPKHLNINKTHFHSNSLLKVTFLKDINAIVNHESSYHVFTSKKYGKKLKNLKPNEFMIGPLSEENHGNWVLSVYTKYSHHEWVEIFQVITLAITESTIIQPKHPVLKLGDTFNLSFVFSIPAIESCEVVAPRSTFDRFFHRKSSDFDKCGFIIPNVTKDDEGIWKIIGVGRIIHQGKVRLRVLGPPVEENNKP